MSTENALARDFARRVLGRGLYPDHWSPGQHDDFLSAVGVHWVCLRQDMTCYHRHDPARGGDWRDPRGGPGRYRAGGHEVLADDKWSAVVVLGSLLCETDNPDPPGELMACAATLLATGAVEVVTPQERPSPQPVPAPRRRRR